MSNDVTLLKSYEEYELALNVAKFNIRVEKDDVKSIVEFQGDLWCELNKTDNFIIDLQKLLKKYSIDN